MLAATVFSHFCAGVAAWAIGDSRTAEATRNALMVRGIVMAYRLPPASVKAKKQGSNALEIALELPGGNHLVRRLELEPRRVEVVLVDVPAEDLPRHGAGLEGRHGL